MRPFIAAANWKMNKTPQEAESFLREFLQLLKPAVHQIVIIFPPALACETVSRLLKATPVQWGGQNCHFETKGAFTGENSPQTLKAMGAASALVGHSERRTLFAESDQLLAKKLKALQDLDLTPMLCIGETLSEREAGHTFRVLEEQLNSDLSAVNWQKPLHIAYEPVWAIGTGKVAMPEQVVEAHAFIRSHLGRLCGRTAEMIPILYGGSVKTDNASELARLENVDGFLVGGASLEAKSFAPIAASRI